MFNSTHLEGCVYLNVTCRLSLRIKKNVSSKFLQPPVRIVEYKRLIKHINFLRASQQVYVS